MPQLDLLFIVGGVHLRINPQEPSSRLQLEGDFAQLTKYFEAALETTFGEVAPLPVIEPPKASSEIPGDPRRVRIRARHGYKSALVEGATKRQFLQLLSTHTPHQILVFEGTEIDAWKFENDPVWSVLP